MLDMDMISPRDRSIRNIPLERQGRGDVVPPAQAGHTAAPLMHEKRGGRHGLWWLIGVVLVCAVSGILLSTVFEKTTITLTAHEASVTPTGPIQASPSASTGNLVYQTFTLSRTASTTSTTSGTQHVSNYATGVVTIYNTYGTKSQTLVATTRFAAPDGKIYKIHSAITVPGETKNADTSISPGTVTATLYADQPGETFNRTDATRFTIPGFKGDAKYTTFYAQSQGPISGGFVGQQAVISPADLSAASKTLKQALQAAIETSTGASNTPDGFVIVPGTLQISFTDIAQNPSTDGSVLLAQSATGRIAMVRLGDLAGALAAQTVAGYKGEAVAFKSPSDVALATASSSSATGIVNISMKGPVALVWVFNKDDVRQALLGKPKASFESIIKAFEPAVDKAEAKVRPFWETSFPSDPSKVDITLLN